MHTEIVELATRESAGISVSLAFDFSEREVLVSVKSSTDVFTLYPPNQCALACYWHPFAYRDRVLTRGTFAEVNS